MGTTHFLNMTGRPLYAMTDGQYQVVYDFLSFTFASMIAATIFFWLRLPSIAEKYKSAMVITGLVTFIASYHYLRIFNSWTEAYKYGPAASMNGSLSVSGVVTTGQPFNDAYRYMDWLLTVPLLLIEIILVMDLSDEETSSKAWQLGSAAALMIILGYPGELILEQSELGNRWIFWCLAMLPFIFIVYTLIVGLANATAQEPDENVRKQIRTAQYMTVLSWLTYPIVYVLPMCGLSGSNAVVAIQMGYCVSDIVSKCGVGFLIYGITNAKSKALKNGLLQNSNM